MHFLQHALFEGPANIVAWAGARGHPVSATALCRGERLPETGDFDWLVIMGGPMNVYEEEEYPWLADEKRLIEKSIAEGKIVLGVCLGAQIIADVLGAPVYKNSDKEIGWHPVFLSQEGRESSVFRGFPDRFVAFHWHGDTFDLPAGCTRLAGSEACQNQAFA
ncbi:MAG: type 1 glutamine amidotransferase, partial [Dehalococcoidia bacterium]|nr:type 1 glutamine amidotransferase [Dehalococcoidia bacterium]